MLYQYEHIFHKSSPRTFIEVKPKKLKKMQNFKVAMSDLQQLKHGFNLSKHQKEQIQNRSNQELKDVFNSVTSKSHLKSSIFSIIFVYPRRKTYTFADKLKLMLILRFIIEGEIAPETFKTELKLEIIPVTTEIEF